MPRFLVKRILLGALVMLIITIIVFAIFYVAPSDPARQLAGHNATPQIIAVVRHNLGLDRPIYVQYGDFLWKLLHGNLGFSYFQKTSVDSILVQALPITLSLALGASVIWFILGVGNGIISAVRPRSLIDRGLTGFALFFHSFPTFLLGIYLLYLVFYRAHLAGFTFFPAQGYVGLTADPVEWFKHLILPWVTLALVLAATYTRLTRTSMLEVLGEDYIRTARAKGIRERRVVLRHGLRSGLTPVITQFGVDVGALVGGVLITEQVFGLPGLGRTAVVSIKRGDLPVVLGIVLFASLCVVVANIIVDMLYAVLDPRVRLN
jgi:peptide/nickel transport system permease protein